MTDGTDSAGVPWAGRRFEPNPSSDDDGSADPGLADALARFRTGDATQADVVDALRTARVLVPIVAREGEARLSAREGEARLSAREGEGGRRAHGGGEASQELSLVVVAAPDGRPALPVFSSVDTMRAWNPDARPIPIAARRVALAAAAEGTELVVVDAASAGEFAVRRSALRALATDARWTHPADDPRVAALVDAALADEPRVLAVRVLAGDPAARLEGPELVVAVVLADGVGDEQRSAVLDGLAARWSTDEELTALVDSIAVTVVGGRPGDPRVS